MNPYILTYSDPNGDIVHLECEGTSAGEIADTCADFMEDYYNSENDGDSYSAENYVNDCRVICVTPKTKDSVLR